MNGQNCFRRISDPALECGAHREQPGHTRAPSLGKRAPRAASAATVRGASPRNRALAAGCRPRRRHCVRRSRDLPDPGHRQTAAAGRTVPRRSPRRTDAGGPARLGEAPVDCRTKPHSFVEIRRRSREVVSCRGRADARVRPVHRPSTGRISLHRGRGDRRGRLRPRACGRGSLRRLPRPSRARRGRQVRSAAMRAGRVTGRPETTILSAAGTAPRCRRTFAPPGLSSLRKRELVDVRPQVADLIEAGG